MRPGPQPRDKRPGTIQWRPWICNALQNKVLSRAVDTPFPPAELRKVSTACVNSVYKCIRLSSGATYQLPEKRREAVSRGDSDTTVEALIVRFLANAEVSPTRMKQLRGCLADIQQHVGGSTEFAEISEQTLRDYRTHILVRMSAGQFGDERGSDFLLIAKQFVRWCVSQSVLISLLDTAVASSIHTILSARKALTITNTT